MLIARAILAAAAVGAVALRPRSARGTAVVALAAAIDLALGTTASTTVAVTAPLVAFLAAALTLAALVQRSGLAARVACLLAAGARGSALHLYVLVCAACALCTAAISLDGAIVLMIPVLAILARRFEAPFAPLFLGAVAVANSASIAVPAGNPTNLVVIERLGLSASGFVAHMLVPGLVAATICATGVAIAERRALTAPLACPPRRRTPLSSFERHGAISVALAAVAAWAATIAGIAPWWPFTAAVALALIAAPDRPRLTVPWRIAVQIAGLLIVIQALGVAPRFTGVAGLGAMLAVAASIGTASALANNLPVSVCATGLLVNGASGYAASIGLAIGSLATPQGSLATLLASQLAGTAAPPVRVSRFAPLAAAGLIAATVLLWALTL